MKKIFISLCLFAAVSMMMNAQTVLADFEDGGVTPTFYNESGDDVVCTVSLEANPDKTGLNTTNKSLYALTSSQMQDAWWGGPRVDFATPFTVNSSNQYLHVMVKTNLPKYEFLVMFSNGGESWAGTYNPTEDGWFDYVIDLTDVKGQDDLTGKNVTGIRVAVSVNDDGQQDKDLYLDEIIVDNNESPRTAGSSGVNNVDLLQGKIYSTANTIILKDICSEIKVFNMTGNCVHSSISNGNASIGLPAGLYLVTANNHSQKVLVK